MKTRTAPLITIALLATVLAGCAQQPAGSDVATINQPGSSSANGSAAPEDRPRLRLDMTDDEVTALYQAYDDCLADNGAGGKARGDADAEGGSVADAGDASDYAAAELACVAFDPLPAWETDRNNPDAMDFMTEVVACLKDKGVKFVEIDADQSSPSINIALGGPQNDMDSISKGMDLIPTCESEVSAAQKK
jgi:hypothetical protein